MLLTVLTAAPPPMCSLPVPTLLRTTKLSNAHYLADQQQWKGSCSCGTYCRCMIWCLLCRSSTGFMTHAKHCIHRYSCPGYLRLKYDCALHESIRKGDNGQDLLWNSNRIVCIAMYAYWNENLFLAFYWLLENTIKWCNYSEYCKCTKAHINSLLLVLYKVTVNL